MKTIYNDFVSEDNHKAGIWMHIQDINQCGAIWDEIEEVLECKKKLFQLYNDKPVLILKTPSDTRALSSICYNEDSIIELFLSTYNKACGYCDSFPFLAHLERYLDTKGSYKKFCKEFKKEAGISWTEGREKLHVVQNSMIDALAKSGGMTKEAAVQWCMMSKDAYKLSLDMFTDELKEYIHTEKRDIVFLVEGLDVYLYAADGPAIAFMKMIRELSEECKKHVCVIVASQYQESEIFAKHMKKEEYQEVFMPCEWKR